MSQNAISQNSYVGEIRIFAGNFPPQGWQFCDGQLLPISENETLFNLIGTTYGGDGQSNFALPDLRGRLAIHEGQGPGLTNRILAETGGTETNTITTTQMPSHNHIVKVVSTGGNQNSPSENYLANTGVMDMEYSDGNGTVTMKPGMVTPVGGSQPHNNMQPVLGVHYIISLEGIYPTPN